MSEAYKSVQFDSLKKMYLEREKLLSVSGPKLDSEEIEQKITSKVHEKTSDLSNLVNILSRKNVTLEDKLSKLETENQSMKYKQKFLEAENREIKEKIVVVEKSLSEVYQLLNKKLE